MKNTLKIGIKETTTEVLMYSSYDDGTNRLFVGLETDIAAHPWIQIGSAAKIYATSNDWRYEIEPTTWRGDSTFTITAGDDNNAGTVYTISQVPAAVTSNIGLEHTSGNTYRLTYAVGSGVDTANDIVTFTSSDVADGQATAWTSVAKLESGETHASMFAKISQMFKNVRYLYKTLGNTDLSAIGGGTVTSIVKSNHNRLALKSRVTKQAKTFTAAKNKTTATSYSVNIALSGYSPIGYSMIHGNSTQYSEVIIGVENFTESVISGFYINKLSSNVTVTFVIAYSRTTD